jgi:hypothetical protein
MAKKNISENMVSEQIMEVRHVPSGSFLDSKGYVADYIRNNKIFEHWQIDNNAIHFRDSPQQIKSDGGFAGFKSAGYIVYNPTTKNYFTDKAKKYWKTLEKNEHYIIPQIIRFGHRTKVFIPIEQGFEYIDNKIKEKVFSNKINSLFSGKVLDTFFSFVIEENGIMAKVQGGPIHKNEVRQYMSFEDELFNHAGVYIDIDIYMDNPKTNIVSLLDSASNLTFTQIEKFANVLEI